MIISALRAPIVFWGCALRPGGRGYYMASASRLKLLTSITKSDTTRKSRQPDPSLSLVEQGQIKIVVEVGHSLGVAGLEREGMLANAHGVRHRNTDQGHVLGRRIAV